MFRTCYVKGCFFGSCCVALIALGVGCADPHQSNAEKSVHPGINDSYKNPDVAKYVGRFETESREIYRERHAILDALEVQTGMDVADVGAGTGLFSLPLATAVGSDGRVFAVDIVPEFLERIDKLADEQSLENITTVLCTERSIELPLDSVDLVFVCDTYHHFEFPRSSLSSIHGALRTGGRLVVIDFIRIPGKSRAWVLDHVRIGQEDTAAEITAAGFERLADPPPIEGLKENFLMAFRKKPAGS